MLLWRGTAVDATATHAHNSKSRPRRRRPLSYVNVLSSAAIIIIRHRRRPKRHRKPLLATAEWELL